MSRMSYNSHGDLLNGKPPTMSVGGGNGNGGGGGGSAGKDYRSTAVCGSAPYNRAALGNVTRACSKPTLVPDLVVEYSRHHHHHDDYVMTSIAPTIRIIHFLFFLLLSILLCDALYMKRSTYSSTNRIDFDSISFRIFTIQQRTILL